jgi:hypothetical protein
VHGALEFFLATACRRKRATTLRRAIFGGGYGSNRQTTLPTIRLAATARRACNISNSYATYRSTAQGGSAAGAASRSFIVITRRFSLRQPPASIFFSAPARLCLGLDASLFFGLTSSGIIALALAALFFFGATLGVGGKARAIFLFARCGAAQGAQTRFLLSARKVIGRTARRFTTRLRGRRRGRSRRLACGRWFCRRRAHRRRACRRRIYRRRLTTRLNGRHWRRSWRWSLDWRRRLRLYLDDWLRPFAWALELALCFDNNGVRAPMRKILPDR